MADRLKYSSSTVKQEIIKIYSIFGINSRQAVLEFARKARLTDYFISSHEWHLLRGSPANLYLTITNNYRIAIFSIKYGLYSFR